MAIRLAFRLPAIIVLAALLAAGQARAGDSAPPVLEREVPAFPEAGREDAQAYRGVPSASPFREHASLALFSLGSLAVGGIFYGIHSSFDHPGGQSASGDGTEVGMAIGAAGLTALAAGASYLYFSWRGRPSRPEALETLSAGLSPEGALSAKLTVPLSALAD